MNSFEKLQKIAEILPGVINVNHPIRIRRGRVHSGICRVLKIPKSNENVKLIKAVLSATGIREVIVKGRPYYASYPDTGMRLIKGSRRTSDK
jgi:hypothetical protein